MFTDVHFFPLCNLLLLLLYVNIQLRALVNAYRRSIRLNYFALCSNKKTRNTISMRMRVRVCGRIYLFHIVADTGRV